MKKVDELKLREKDLQTKLQNKHDYKITTKQQNDYSTV